MSINVNANRLWNSLMEIAKIGATDKGGSNRQALTDEDIAGRALFAHWCEDYGFGISYDSAGNMFARLEGQDNTLPPLVIGSHLDTQPTGGKFDGVMGVLSGLEVMRVLSEQDVIPPRPVEVAAWMNEEGARFAPAMMGSGVFSGMLSLEDIRASKDQEGITVGDELDRHGYSGNPNPKEKEMDAYLELHIEQGPVLEANDKEIGIVTGAQGIRWYDLSIAGQEVHAGPVPMKLRKDPMVVVPKLVQRVFDIGTIDEDARATIGQFHANPGSRNVVPGSIDMTIDLRHPNEDTLARMHAQLTVYIEKMVEEYKDLSLKSKLIWHSPVVAFNNDLIEAVRAGAVKHNYTSQDIVSGAGHDALMVARRVPTTMIFIPCKDGISHNAIEWVEPSQVAAGANVLLETVCTYLKMK